MHHNALNTLPAKTAVSIRATEGVSSSVTSALLVPADYTDNHTVGVLFFSLSPVSPSVSSFVKQLGGSLEQPHLYEPHSPLPSPYSLSCSDLLKTTVSKCSSLGETGLGKDPWPRWRVSTSLDSTWNSIGSWKCPVPVTDQLSPNSWSVWIVIKCRNSIITATTFISFGKSN